MDSNQHKNITLYKIAKTDKEKQEVYSVRQKIYVENLNYRKEMIEVEKGENYYHFFAKKNTAAIGVLSIHSPQQNEKLHLEKYINLDIYKSKKNAEVIKLAVINPRIHAKVGITLIALSYLHIQSLCSDRVFIASLNINNDYTRIMYEKIGFKAIGTINYENIAPATVLYFDFKKFELNDSLQKILAECNKIYYELIGKTL